MRRQLAPAPARRAAPSRHLSLSCLPPLTVLTVEGHAQAVGSGTGGTAQLLLGGVPGEGEARLGGLRGGDRGSSGWGR